MPFIRQYPETITSEPTDAFVIDRVGVGTLYIEAQYITGGTGNAGLAVTTSQDLFAGAFVNVYLNSGVLTARLADATDITKPVNGFVLLPTTSGETAAVYSAGLNATVTVGADTPQVWSSTTVSGGFQTTAPPLSPSGNVAQPLGIAQAGVGILVSIGAAVER